MSAHFDMEIHDDEFQSGVPADKQPTVSDVLSTWRETVSYTHLTLPTNREV